MTVLGFTGPGVSATNLLFNVIAIPSGVFRYIREGRMLWSLTIAIILGTLPGVLAGVFIRIQLFSDPRLFKLFVAGVLAYIASRLIKDIFMHSHAGAWEREEVDTMDDEFIVKDDSLTLKWISFNFQGQHYQVSSLAVFSLSLVVGVIGGVYGIGGGAIIAPFLVAVFKLPVHTIAGASLMGTFITSFVGVIFYAWVAPHFAANGLNVQPDWGLGALFGIGGAIGMYMGARMQRYIKADLIKKVILVCLAVVVVKYLGEFFLNFEF